MSPEPALAKPIVIGIAGSHATGKSTFLTQLKGALRETDVRVAVVPDYGQQAMSHGLELLHNHTWASTLWFIASTIAGELAAWPHAEVILVDRVPADALGYYRAALKFRNQSPDPQQWTYLASVVRGHSVHTDLLYRTALDPGARAQGTPQDARFRALADEGVASVLAELGLMHHVLPPTSSRERVIEDAVTTTLDLLAARPQEEP